MLSSMLVEALKTDAFTVEQTASAHDALQRAQRHRPSIVVSDVHLAEGDGYSLLRSMRDDPALASVQFVLMTGDMRHTAQRTGMNLGANDYLAKPFTVDDFSACMQARRLQAQSWHRIEMLSLERMKNTVSSVLPHEFFTPLAGIMGLSELLKEEVGQMSPEYCREQLNEIRGCARRLQRVLENYLTILRLSAENPFQRRDPQTIVLSDLLQVFAASAAEVAERHQRTDDLRLDCALSGDQAMLYLESDALSKIVGELVDNACKFSKPGQPVSARLEAVHGELELVVRDEGRGMSRQEIAQIGAFRQFDRSLHEQQGLGLGLTLAQYLIECSGGRFEIESEPDAGSTVHVRWRLSAAISR